MMGLHSLRAPRYTGKCPMKINVFGRLFLSCLFIFTTTSVALADQPAATVALITPLTPVSGTTVAQHTGAINLKWKPLTGTRCYQYTIEFNAYGSWLPVGAADGSTCKGSTGTMTLDRFFVRQYGPSGVALRWRVWTTDKGATSISSPWTPFTFKSTGNVNFKNPPVDMRPKKLRKK